MIISRVAVNPNVFVPRVRVSDGVGLGVRAWVEGAGQWVRC